MTDQYMHVFIEETNIFVETKPIKCYITTVQTLVNINNMYLT